MIEIVIGLFCAAFVAGWLEIAYLVKGILKEV
jgi:hypothetical protein